MPIINRIADLHAEITEWRHDFHMHPELLFDVHRTAAIVETKLKEFGCDSVHFGMGRTGVVGVIKGKSNKSGKVIGLRADMDALPIMEAVELPYKSTVPGKMHACGHDGHTSMLLGAAKYLCETRNFDGTAIIIFQPAEEGGGGGREMVQDGLMTKYNIDEVYGLHNMPSIPLGTFAVKTGAIMAAADRFFIDITGKGGHGAAPHMAIDPVLVGATLVQALQSIVSRNADPVEGAVLSVCTFHAGDTDNVIPHSAKLSGTVRTYAPLLQDMIERRISEVAAGIALATGSEISVEYKRGYPVTINSIEQTDFAVTVAQDIVGAKNVDANTPPLMGAEDFSFMLNERPGCYIFLGNGDTPMCHHPAYQFSDEAIPFGTSYWVKIIEKRMPA